MADLAECMQRGETHAPFQELRQRSRLDRMASLNHHPSWKDVFRRRWLSKVKSRRFDSMLRNRFISEVEEDSMTDDMMQESLDTVSPMQGCSSPPCDRQEMSLQLLPWSNQSPRCRARFSSSVSSSSSSGGSCSLSCSSFSAECSLQSVGHASSAGQLVNDDELSMRMDLSPRLISAERRINHYLGKQGLNDAELCNALELLNTGEVVCPICKRNPLQHSSSVVWCNCGLHIDTEQETLSMEYIRCELHEAVDQHGTSCVAQPRFSLNSEPSIDLVNLILHCEFVIFSERDTLRRLDIICLNFDKFALCGFNPLMS